MASGWQKKWSRLTHLSWHEVRTRLGQEGSKRFDLALYRVGLKPWEDRRRSQATASPRFFFGEDNHDLAHRAALLRQHLPGEADRIVQQADRICRHQFDLLGYEALDFGPKVDWHLDPVHGKRSPLKPWYKINFLDVHQAGDHKIVWELNRHQHLVTLAKAWRLSGHRVYADELVNQWYSWHKANPYPLGINWASTLEVSFRSMSWLWVRHLLAGCADLPASLEEDMLLALQVHGRYIERYLSTYFSPNTHLIGEAVALFFLGTLCPELSAAERWQDTGWRILLKESDRQVRADGVYFEQALYYHVYALDFFLHARLLASENGRAIPQHFDEALKKMLDVVAALSEAGPIQGFGDDDGGRVFNPRRNRVEHMTDPLALGTVLYDRNYAAATLTEEAIWLFGDKAIEACARPRVQAATASKALQSGGIYLINDDKPFPQQMMIDAGPQGTGHSGHGHADALSICFSIAGRRVLVDPGTFAYISDNDDRNMFRGTAAHNTLRVDGLDQAIPRGPFAWDSIPKVQTEIWLNGRTFDLFAGSHDGYRRLSDPVLHHRYVFHVKGGPWIVRDIAEGLGSHLLETFRHFAPEIEVKAEAGAFVIEWSADQNNSESSRMALLFDQKCAWKAGVTQSFVSPAYGLKQAAPLLHASVNATLPSECAVMLLPVPRAADIGTFATIDEAATGGVRGYRYHASDRTELIFFSREKTPWKSGRWASDAQLLYCKMEAGWLVHVIMVAGSFAEWGGKRFVSHPSVVESFEWTERPESRTSPTSGCNSVRVTP